MEIHRNYCLQRGEKYLSPKFDRLWELLCPYKSDTNTYPVVTLEQFLKAGIARKVVEEFIYLGYIINTGNGYSIYASWEEWESRTFPET